MSYANNLNFVTEFFKICMHKAYVPALLDDKETSRIHEYTPNSMNQALA